MPSIGLGGITQCERWRRLGESNTVPVRELRILSPLLVPTSQPPATSNANGSCRLGNICGLFFCAETVSKTVKSLERNAKPTPNKSPTQGPGGEILTETTLAGTINEEYAYFNGERIARIDRPSGTVNYYFSNHLGSASVITSATGVIQEQMDFYPFGGVAYTSGSDPNHYKFTGKERDSESGLDNFGARYYGSSMGRMMSPDWSAKTEPVPYAKLGDPQTLNLYAYVGNNPLSRTDPTGHCEFRESGCGDNARCQTKWDKRQDKFEKRRQKDLHSKKADVRSAAAAFGARGEANGVHVGFADSKGAYNGVTNPFSSTPGNIDIEVTIDNSRVGSDTQEHEGAHIADNLKFLDSFDPKKGGYDQSLNITHGQTEFNGLKVGAEIDGGHGLNPNNPQQIWDFIRNSPVYGPVINNLVFPPALFPGPSGPED